MKEVSYRYCLVFLILFLGLSTSVEAQDCQSYIQLDDVAGFDVAPFQIELETATCNFLQAFPELQDSFKVFDFGFYLHHESYTGGFPDVFQQKIEEVANQSPYYLVFGKQTDQSGIYTKFWIDLKLPASGQFQCLDLVASDFRENLETRIHNHANNIYEIQGGKPENYAEAEIQALAELKRQLDLLSECCDPGFNPKSGEVCYNCPSTGYDILKEMIDAGLVLEEIHIIEDGEAGGGTSTASGNTSLQKNLTTLDMTVSFSDDEQTWDLDNFFDELLVDNHVLYYRNRLGLGETEITVGKHYYKYPEDCQFKEKYEAYLADQSDLKLFVGIININGNIGVMAYKVGGHASYRDKVKGEIVIDAIHNELDKIEASTDSDLRELTVQHLNRSGATEFPGLITLEDDFLSANYQLAISKYQELKDSYDYNALDRYRGFWSDEYNYYIINNIGPISGGERIINSIKVSWNMISGAVHANYNKEEYARRYKSLLLELLLMFDCATKNNEDEFLYVVSKGQEGQIFRGHLEESPLDQFLLINNITIINFSYGKTEEGIYSVTKAVSIVPPDPIDILGEYWRIVIAGSNNFTCEIVVQTEGEAETLEEKFINGIGGYVSTNYEGYKLALENTANSCSSTEEAKDILAAVPSCALELISDDARIKLINCLVDEFEVNTEEEYLINKLLAFPNDACDFIAKAQISLDADKLIKAVDNSTNTRTLIGHLIRVFSNCNSSKGLSDDENAQNGIVIDEQLVGGSSIQMNYSISGFNLITLYNKYVDQTYSPYQPIQGGNFVIREKPISSHELFEPVILITDIDVESINLHGNIEFCGVPAIVAPLIIKNYNLQEFYEDLTTTLTVVSMVTFTTAELAAAYSLYRATATSRNLFRLGLATLDFGVTMIDGYCNSSPTSDICTKWNKVSFYVSVGLIGLTVADLSIMAPRLLAWSRLEQNYPNVHRLLAEGQNFDVQTMQRFETYSLEGSTEHTGFLTALDNDLKPIIPGQNSEFFDYLALDGKRVRAWEVLYSSNKEAVRLLRTDVDRLEDLSRFIANNPDDVSRVVSELNLPNTHVAQYLDYIKYVGTDLEHFYTTFRLYTDPQGRSWQEYLNWLNNSNTFKVGLPPYQGKTYEEVMDIVLQSDRYSHMTKSDAYIAFSYTTGYFYNTVNGWIRTGEEVVLSQQIMDGVLPSLAKLPQYDANTVFYRAIKVKPEDLSAFLDEYVDGADVSKDFIQSIATREQDSFIGRPDYNIEFEIRGKTTSSSQARDIHDFAWAKYWNTTNPAFPRTLSEGVFMPGSNLRVVELESEINGVRRFILEEF